MPCERCGSELPSEDDDVKQTFKCITCQNIKVERHLLEPLVSIIRENFKNLKERFGFVRSLYAFGSYAAGAAKCCDVDLLLIIDEDIFNRFIEGNLEFQREDLWDFVDPDDNNSIITYLDNDAFFDFRKCQEYPDACLECYEEEDCSYQDEYWRERPNYCLESCDQLGIPPCMMMDPYCGWEENWDKTESRRLFLENFQHQLKKNADKSFKISNLSVKVIHLFCSWSLEQFYEKNEDLEFTTQLLE